MNSAARSGICRRSDDTSPWDNVRRIYRHACELRAAGRPDEAVGIEQTELAAALTAARLTGEPVPVEAVLLAEEEERVATARLLAELLAPMLAGRLRGTSAPSAAGFVPPGSSRGHALPPPGVSPGIADLIDGMLAQAAASRPSTA